MSEVTGYFSGIFDIYYALITTQDSAAAKPTYSAPEVLAKGIEATLTPTYKEGKLHASNKAVRHTRRIDGYDVAIEVDKVPADKLQKVLGRSIDKNKVQIIKGGNRPAGLALGLAYTLDDGSRELWWLYKGEFAEIVKTGKTEGDNIEYQTPKLTGAFVRRIFDDALAAVVETSTEGIGATVEAQWFTTVYEEAAGA